MTYFYLIECESIDSFGDKKSSEIEKRYQPSLLKYMKCYENGFDYLGYKFELIRTDELDDKRLETIDYNKIFKFVYLCNSEQNKKDDALKFISGNNTFEPNENNHFFCDSCDIYFDKLKGAVLVNETHGVKIKNLLSDYALALAYIKKIQKFQERVSSINELSI